MRGLVALVSDTGNVNRDQYAAALQAVGHYRGAVIHQDNGRFRAECECGYVSATRMTARLAIEAIEHHRRKELAASRINGVSLPDSALRAL